MSPIGVNIKKIRKQNSMTQNDLAEKLFVTRQTVSNWESGKSYPNIINIQKLAQVLNVDTAQLIDEEERKRIYQGEDLLRTQIDGAVENESVGNKKTVQQLMKFIIVATVYVCMEILLSVFIKPIAASEGYVGYYYFCSLIRPIIIVLVTLYMGYLMREVLGMRRINPVAQKICLGASVAFLVLFCIVMISGMVPLSSPSYLLFYAYEIGTLGFPFIFVGILLFLGVTSPKASCEEQLSKIIKTESV